MKNPRRNLNIEPIHGVYPCKKCSCVMKPSFRIEFSRDFGVRHLHICPNDGCLFIESEYAKA